jgi:hypothetical protein
LLAAGSAVAAPGDTLIFIDMNSNLHEFLAARDSAARLGLHFASIPTEADAIPLDQLTESDGECNERLERAANQEPADDAKVQRLQKACGALDERLSKVQEKLIYNPGEALTKLIQKLAAEKHSVSTFVLSGHHSGGDFGGNTMTSDVLEDDQLKTIIASNPAVLSSVTTIALWGCAGVTVPDAAQWRVKFPGLKVLAGFYDSAPLGIRPESYHYLTGLIMGAADLPKIESPAALRHRIVSIPGVADTYSGLYVHTDGGQDWIYYHGSDDEKAHFESLTSTIRCESFNGRFAAETKTVSRFFDGSDPLPTDGDASPLRKAYFDFAQNKDCYTPAANTFAPSQAGLLRFYETGFKQNFGLVFRDLLDSATAEWRSVDVENLRSMMRVDWAADAGRSIVAAEAKLEKKIAAERESLQIAAETRAKNSPEWTKRDEEIATLFAALPKRLRRQLDALAADRNYPAILEASESLRPHLRSKASTYLDTIRDVVATRKKLVEKEESGMDAERNQLAADEANWKKYEANRTNGYSAIDAYVAKLTSARAQIGTVDFSNRFLHGNRAEMVALYRSVAAALDFRNFPAAKTSMNATFGRTLKLMRATDRVLYRMDPACVDLLDWHEVTRSAPNLKCSID